MAVGIKTSPGIKLRRSVRGCADTDYANECSMQSHYEPCREVVSLGYFLMKYCWKWALVRWCLFRGQQNRGGGKK